MNTKNNEPRTAGLVSRFFLKLGGATEATLRLCGDQEWDKYRMLGLLLFGSVCFEAVNLCVIAHEILAPDGNIHPGLIAGAIAVSALIGAIDWQMFLSSSAIYADGVRALAAGGIIIPTTLGDKMRRVLALSIRSTFCGSLAQVSTLSFGLILYGPDIQADLNRKWQVEDATPMAEGKVQIDNEIQNATTAVKAEEGHVTALQNRLGAMRDGAVNPDANDSATKAQEGEISQLLAEKGRRDAELSMSQAFAANELVGVKAEPGNSGVRGRGPVRAAAEEREKAAAANVAAADKALDEARKRLDALHKAMASSDGERSQQARQQLPQLEKELEAATAQLATLRDNLTKLAESRETRIREFVESAPDHIGREQGLLARLGALKRRIYADHETAVVVALIDIVFFILELCLVAGKMTNGGVSVYAALSVRDSLMRVSRIVEGMATELDRGPNPDTSEPQMAGPANGNVDPTFRAPPSVNPLGFPAQPQKRPRGRPRKPRPDPEN